MVDMTLTAPTIKSEAAYRRGRLLRQFSLYGGLTFAALVMMIPFFYMISTSLMTLGETQLKQLFPSGSLQFVNYVDAWNDANFGHYFTNSLLQTVITIIGLLIMSILAAYAFARIQFFGRNLIFTLLLATLMVPDIVTMIPNYLVVAGSVFPMPLTTESFPFVSWQLGNSWIDTLPVLTVPFMGSAFSIFLMRQFFMQIPNELWEAARIDGAGHLRFLIQIVLPISQPVILTVSLLTFIDSWNALLWPLIVTNGERWRPLTVGLKVFQDDAGTNLHLLMAGSFIAIMPVLLVYFLTQKTFTQGIATTGLKG